MTIDEARDALGNASQIAVLTGAGVSAESGIPTFRDAQTGLWARFTPEDLASPQAYARDPQFVWSWYAERYGTCAQAEPNAAHHALAELEREKGDGFTLVTQNVDGLHARAGSRRLVELHGNLSTGRCEACGNVQALPDPKEFTPPPSCERCGSPMRPNVVWFGEMLPREALERAWDAFLEAEVALVVGTSAVVEPAASLARLGNALVIEVNPRETPLSPYAGVSLRMGAVEGMRELLGADA